MRFVVLDGGTAAICGTEQDEASVSTRSELRPSMTAHSPSPVVRARLRPVVCGLLAWCVPRSASSRRRCASAESAAVGGASQPPCQPGEHSLEQPTRPPRGQSSCTTGGCRAGWLPSFERAAAGRCSGSGPAGRRWAGRSQRAFVPRPAPIVWACEAVRFPICLSCGVEPSSRPAELDWSRAQPTTRHTESRTERR